MSFVTKDLPNEIMKSSRLRNSFPKNKICEGRPLYTKKKYYVTLLRKSKKVFWEPGWKKGFEQQAFLESCQIFTFW